MKKTFLTAAFLIFGSLFLSACRDAGSPFNGTWYEQEPDGCTITISGNSLALSQPLSNGGTYSAEAKFKASQQDGIWIFEMPEDFYDYADISYDPSEDVIRAHTMPVMDGDGGYHLRTFRRTAYTAPPAPVYDPPADLSDPDARKVFDDMTIRSMHVSFYDEGAWHDPYSNMAPMEPFEGEYGYDLTVQDDGSALVSSTFCKEITLSEEGTEELMELIREADLGSINGTDIHTEGLPYGSPDYTLELELASGETIRSSANGPDVPGAWSEFQEPMHYLLYFAFRNAGYAPGGEFHSTAPMKRLGTGTAPAPISWKMMLDASKTGCYGYDVEEDPEEDAEETGAPLQVSYKAVRIEPDWEKAYDYDLHTEYPVFLSTEPENPAVMKTLQRLNTQFKSNAEQFLKEDYDMMNAVPASVWKKADRRYCYSFCSIANDTDKGLFWSFLVSEGHANSLGAGKYGYGYYPHIRYNIDKETGGIIPAAELFTDKATAVRWITAKMRSGWGTHREDGVFIHSDEFPKRLAEIIGLTGPEGIRWAAGYNSVEMYFPTTLFTMNDTEIREVFYYDEMQDILSDTYSTVW